jgi:hypothetical protein
MKKKPEWPPKWAPQFDAKPKKRVPYGCGYKPGAGAEDASWLKGGLPSAPKKGGPGV